MACRRAVRSRVSLAVLALGACAPPRAWLDPDTIDVPDAPLEVPLEDVRRAAHEHEGAKVRTCGWLYLRFESDALFGSSYYVPPHTFEAWRQNLATLDVPHLDRETRRACNEKYVCVTGILRGPQVGAFPAPRELEVTRFEEPQPD